MDQGRLVEFTMGKSEKYPEAVLLNAVGYSLPSWDWVFKLRDTLTSEFHSDTFLPYEFSRKAHEGNYHKTFDYSFDYTNQKAYGVINKIGKYIRQDTDRVTAGDLRYALCGLDGARA